MPGNDLAKLFEIEHVSFDELQDARFVLGPTRLQSDGCNMFGGKHRCGNSLHVSLGCLSQSFFRETVANRQKLNGPASNDNVMTRDLPIARSRHHTTYAAYPTAARHPVFCLHETSTSNVAAGSI